MGGTCGTYGDKKNAQRALVGKNRGKEMALENDAQMGGYYKN